MGVQLSKNEIEEKLKVLNDWSYKENTIFKIFELDNFSNAIALTVQIGLEAEKLDHHPDILIYSWNKVKVILSTHSVGGISELDFVLARKIDSIIQ
ncbi:MAG: 4a-hydroxytetrahydrobiopterin dehydratase [Melioribacteraceae bacterium]|nr:4a-hydroxytetrahydrobiopterin dehydratase [Melioribacteraceae bacterium]